jgi:UDPglucose 6-dehydrogenase
MNITVVGFGSIELVSGDFFLEMGTKITCVDVNTKNIEDYRIGK